MPAERLNFNTPPGRFVSGSLTEKNTFAYDNSKPNNRGEMLPDNKHYYYIGVAFRKDQVGGDFQNVDGMIAAVFGHAQKGYQANGTVLARINGHHPCDPNSLFAWKISDGDAATAQPGQQPTINPNTAGCWIVSFRTTQPIKFARRMPHDQSTVEIGPDEIQRGYYVDLSASVAINEKTDGTAGVYWNPGIVRLIGHGPIIAGGPSIEQAFGDKPAPIMPVGASAAPVAPPMAQQPQYATQQMPMPGQQQMPMPGQQPQYAPQQPVPTQLPGAPAGGGYAQPAMPQPMPAAPQYAQQPMPGQQPIASHGNVPPHTGFVNQTIGYAPPQPMPGQLPLPPQR